MKIIIKFQIVLATLLLTTFINCHAQKSSDPRSTMDQIVKKYDGKQGITAMKVAKGSGLELVKLMFNHEFGKDFMKGVTSITVIEYSEAPAAICTELRKDLDVFTSLLQEFDLSEENDLKDNDYIRCFASESDSEVLTDFLVALENKESKMVMYMTGKIKVEDK